MHTFDLYGEAWVVYIVLGIVLLWLLDLKLKRRALAIRLGVLTLIATAAFTPSTVGDAQTHSPLIIAALFNAEMNGVSELYQGLLLLLLVWGGVFSLSLAAAHFIQTRRQSKDNHQSDQNQTDETQPEAKSSADVT